MLHCGLFIFVCRNKKVFPHHAGFENKSWYLFSQFNKKCVLKKKKKILTIPKEKLLSKGALKVWFFLIQKRYEKQAHELLSPKITQSDRKYYFVIIVSWISFSNQNTFCLPSNAWRSQRPLISRSNYFHISNPVYFLLSDKTQAPHETENVCHLQFTCCVLLRLCNSTPGIRRKWKAHIRAVSLLRTVALLCCTCTVSSLCGLGFRPSRFQGSRPC